MTPTLKSWLTIALLALCLVAPAPAATVSYQGTVQMVYPQSDGSFVIVVPSTLAVCLSSGGTSYLYVVPGANGVTTDGAKAMLATVLTGFALDKTIIIAYDDSSSSCYVNRLAIQ